MPKSGVIPGNRSRFNQLKAKLMHTEILHILTCDEEKMKRQEISKAQEAKRASHTEEHNQLVA